MNPLKWLLTKNEPKPKEAIVTDTVVETAAEPTIVNTSGEPVTTQATTVSTTETDAVLNKLKKLVEAAGAQAHAVFDDLIELAKKLA